MSEDGDEIPAGEEFFLPEDGDPETNPAAIARRLILTLEEFDELLRGEAKIAYLMRAVPVRRQGISVLGTLALPVWQGGSGMGALAQCAVVRWLGFLPDYLMILDAGWWAEATPHQREALVHHELMHGQQKRDRDGELVFDEQGDPVWVLKGHHIEEWCETVRRYGAWEAHVQPFVDAAREGGVR